MKRIIKKILEAVRTISSRFGFTFGEPSGSHRSTPPPSKVNLDQAPQEYGDEKNAEAIQPKDDADPVAPEPTSLLPDSSGTIQKDGPEVLESDTLAQEPPEDHSHSNDAVDKETTEELAEKKIISINQANDKPSKAEQPSEDAGSEIEPEPAPHQPIKDVTESSSVESINNDNLSEASENLAVDKSTKTTTEPALSIKKSEDAGSSNDANQICKEDSVAEVESVEEESKRSDQSVSDSKSKRVADGERTPRPRRPAPKEDASEYKIVVGDIATVDQEYAHWNRVIVDHILLTKPRSEDIYLCVNPRILAKVFDEAGLEFLNPEHAEQRFSTAVANVYRKRVLGHRDHLQVLRRCSDDGYPDCAAFLAGSVLAAYHMQSDEEVSGNAYYKRLAKLLSCDMQANYPIGFNPPIFESLWVYLQNWLHKEHGRQLIMPRSDGRFRRFVALPLAHVPLRSLDIEKLPSFFVWAGYQPGGRVRRDRLLSGLQRWQQSKNMLTPTGAESLSDDRVDAVVAQVSAELESWDGSFVESASRRSALVEIQFDIIQRNPVFSFIPRRPSGFPSVFDDGDHVFEASDEGWYDPVKICPLDGELLETGFEWRSDINGTQFVLRRSKTLAVPLVPSSTYSGFLSSPRLLRGIKCSVLCHNKVIGRVQEYLSEVAQQQLNLVTGHSSLPNNWSLFRDVTANVHVEAPSDLEALEVNPNIELVVAGGLRIGRRWSWLVGAPPQILVSGMERFDQVKVNGASVEVDMNGELLINDVLDKPGQYLIEAGDIRRRIEIARPQISIHEKAERCDSPDSDQIVKVALPRGDWTLIGNSPEQVCYSRGGFFRGTLASCPFHPSWAIQVGAGPGAIIVVFANPSSPQVGGSQRTRQFQNLIKRWVSVVYASHIRRPHFIGLNGTVMDEGIVDIWKQYVAVAKNIKRELKGK